jgi:hypothetical protein
MFRLFYKIFNLVVAVKMKTLTRFLPVLAGNYCLFSFEKLKKAFLCALHTGKPRADGRIQDMVAKECPAGLGGKQDGSWKECLFFFGADKYRQSNTKLFLVL